MSRYNLRTCFSLIWIHTDLLSSDPVLVFNQQSISDTIHLQALFKINSPRGEKCGQFDANNVTSECLVNRLGMFPILLFRLPGHKPNRASNFFPIHRENFRAILSSYFIVAKLIDGHFSLFQINYGGSKGFRSTFNNHLCIKVTPVYRRTTSSTEKSSENLCLIHGPFFAAKSKLVKN